MNNCLSQSEEMAGRGRHYDRGDVYSDYRSRERDHDPYDSRGRDHKPRGPDKRGSDGDRRSAQADRHRDTTTASDMGPPAPRDHYYEGPPSL